MTRPKPRTSAAEMYPSSTPPGSDPSTAPAGGDPRNATTAAVAGAHAQIATGEEFERAVQLKIAELRAQQTADATAAVQAADAAQVAAEAARRLADEWNQGATGGDGGNAKGNQDDGGNGAAGGDGA